MYHAADPRPVKQLTRIASGHGSKPVGVPAAGTSRTILPSYERDNVAPAGGLAWTM
jgi:hypothetical protein